MGRELSVWIVGSEASRQLPSAVLRDAGFAVHASNGASQPPARPPCAMLVVDEAAGEQVCSEAQAHFADVPLACLRHLDDAAPTDVVFEYIEPTPGLANLPETLRAICHRWSRIWALKETARILQQVESTAELAYFEYDAETDRIRWSESLSNLLGVDPAAGMPPLADFLDFVHPADVAGFERDLRGALDSATPLSTDFRILGPLGKLMNMHARGTPPSRASSPRKLFCVVEDVTRFQHRVDRAEKLSLADPLTGLGNRRVLASRGPQILEEAKRAGTTVGLLYIDLDRFKILNDTLGHETGDAILTSVAARFMDTLRASDVVCRDPGEGGEAPLVSRLGGDEFIILIPNLSSAELATRVAQRVQSTLAEPIVLDGHTLSIRSSIGLATFPDDAETMDELVRRADCALYHVKRSGGFGCQAYSPALEIRAQRKLRVEMRLRRALEEGLLALHFQPRVRLPERKVVGLEALLRWNDPELGTVPPPEAIRVAEDAGLAPELGRWILESACRRLRALREASGEDLLLSVNVSPLQVEHGDFYGVVAEALQQHDIPPHRLELDLTERVLQHGGEAIGRTLHELRAIGVRLALDDFGTGQSSLQSLTRFPLDTLKVDRALVRDFDPEGVAAKLMIGVLGMAHALGLGTVAEGVATQEQADFLVSHDCLEMQGYLFSAPLPEDEIASLLCTPGLDPGATRATQDGSPDDAEAFAAERRPRS